MARRALLAPMSLYLVWALVGIMVKFPEQTAMRLTGGAMTLALLAVSGWILWSRRTPSVTARAGNSAA